MTSHDNSRSIDDGRLARLRAAGRRAHDRVDRAFSGFDLSDPASYEAFLVAHARSVLPLEAVLRDRADLPGWTMRGDLLTEDLAGLGRGLPPPVVLPAMRDGWHLGALYVLEGSRLGGRVLAGRVAVGLPRAYLAAGHGPGGWRGFLDGVEACLMGRDEAYLAAAVAGVVDVFGLFERAGDAA